MNIEQFISQLESCDAYRTNGEVKKLVDESRQTLVDLAHGNDGDAFKVELIKFKERLDRCLALSAAVPKEVAEWAEQLGLGNQYADIRMTLIFLDFLGTEGKTKQGNAPLPTYEKAMASFTPEMLKLAATFQEPTLLLVPECSFARKVKAIDNLKWVDGQNDTHTNEPYKKFDSGSEKITGWKVVIVEGAKEMKLKERDDPDQRFDVRIEDRKAARKPGEKGMERHAYALLMMESLRKGDPIDKGTYTLLDDDAAPDSAVLSVGWDTDSRVNFDSNTPSSVGSFARFRSSVGGDMLLSATESTETLDTPNLLKQYVQRMVTLSFYGFLDKSGEAKKGDKPFPSFEKVKATFTPEMLELAATFQEPTLLLVPETSFAAKVKAIDTHKSMEGQIDTYQDGLYKESDSGSEIITGWKAVIVDGAKEMELKEGDDKGKRFDERIEKRKADRKPSEKGMGRHAYALLMMESLRKGEPIDQWKDDKGTYTLLDDVPDLSASRVPNARWYDGGRRARFDANVHVYVYGGARLRSSVGGEVIL